jgi:hypothetical protein
MIKILGFIILGISCLLFIMIPVVPWFDLSKGKIAGITTGLFISGEVTFYLSLFILGRSFFDKIKSRLKFRKVKPPDIKVPDQGPNK